MKVNNYFWLAIAGILFPMISFAEEAAHATGAAMGSAGWVALAVGFGVSLAVVAATTAQGRIASAFMEGASRNPGAADAMKTQFILGLAFVESLVLFCWLLAYLLMGNM